MPRFLYTISPRTVTVMVGSESYGADRTSANWPAIKEALKNPETTNEEMIELLSPKGQKEAAVAAAAKLIAEGPPTNITFINGKLYHNGEAVNTYLAERLQDIWVEELPVEAWVNFARKVYSNPEPFAITELLEWLEIAKMPICPDGDFLAYKYVTSDYKDRYSRTFDNHVGSIVQMPRERVDKNRRQACSTGLHFCSREYLGCGSQNVMIVKINPADVVSIPLDSGLTKGRCWRYEVVGQAGHENSHTAVWESIVAGSVVEVPMQAPAPDLATRGKAAKKSKAKKREKPQEVFEDQTPKKKLVINSPVHGKITPTRFKKLLKEHGSKRAMAHALGISEGTLQSWKKKLGL